MRGAVFFALGLFVLASPCLASERLQVPHLEGWKVLSSVSDASGEATDMIPVTEDGQNWTRRISVQAFRTVPLTVAGFLDQVISQAEPVCDNASAGPASMGRVSGLEAGSRTLACGKYKGDGHGTFVLHFVIRGREAFYVVSRMWRGAPFALGQVPVPAAELATWRDYADAITVCDTSDPVRPCRE